MPTKQPLSLTRHWINQWEIIRREPTSWWRRLSAPQLFAGSFLMLILLGTVGLVTIPGLYTGEPLSWLDALFTATSAVCVTGLIVVDTATYFTVRGQAFLLLLIQLGGLGMITFTTLIILVLRRRLSLRHEQLTTVAEVAPHVNFQRLTRDVIVFTGLFELAGALLLYLLWIPRFGWQGAGWPALFHSISAFCNAGFSIFSDSLTGFQRAPFSLLIVMLLIVAGGLGFLTLEELYLRQRAIKENRRFRISLHSRLVVTATITLLIGAWLLYTIFEWRLTLAEIPIWARPFNSLFMSVTARTAGFNTINYEDASASTNFLTILLMAIGGAPGSTAGGLKVTTMALLVSLAWSRFHGREIASLWGRSVPEETMQRAVGLFVVGFVVLTAAIFAFISLELHGSHASGQRSFLHYMFEATSAFNTVGLSMGVTPELQAPSRWLTIVLMYVGRIGPLTFAAAIALARYTARGEFRFAYEDVVVG